MKCRVNAREWVCAPHNNIRIELLIVAAMQTHEMYETNSNLLRATLGRFKILHSFIIFFIWYSDQRIANDKRAVSEWMH